MIRSVSYYWYRMGNQRFMKYLVWSVVFLLTISIQSSHVFAENHCASDQHGYLGKEGIISCNISQGIDKVYWFNETDEYHHPFIRMEYGHKSGSGYKSNEYDILQNGSLIIRNVQYKHQQSYKVTFEIETQVDLLVNFSVRVPTTSNSGSTLPNEVTSIVQSTKVETDNSRSVTTEPQFTTTYTTETTKPEDSNRGYLHLIWIVVAVFVVLAVIKFIASRCTDKKVEEQKEKEEATKMKPVVRSAENQADALLKHPDQNDPDFQIKEQ